MTVSKSAFASLFFFQHPLRRRVVCQLVASAARPLRQNDRQPLTKQQMMRTNLNNSPRQRIYLQHGRNERMLQYFRTLKPDFELFKATLTFSRRLQNHVDDLLTSIASDQHQINISSSNPLSICVTAFVSNICCAAGSSASWWHQQPAHFVRMTANR